MSLGVFLAEVLQILYIGGALLAGLWAVWDTFFRG